MAVDSEVIAFTRLVADVRREFKHDDAVTNSGIVESSRIDSVYPVGTSVKLVVYANRSKRSKSKMAVVKFTCDGKKMNCLELSFIGGTIKRLFNWLNAFAHTLIQTEQQSLLQASKIVYLLLSVTSHVEHIVFKAVSDLEDDLGRQSASSDVGGFVLQVAGTSEYLDTTAKLMDYQYVHECYKYDRDVAFVLVPLDVLEKPYLRTVRNIQTFFFFS